MSQEELAGKAKTMLNKNWVLIDSMIKVYLHVALSKREAICVMRRALDLMEQAL